MKTGMRLVFTLVLAFVFATQAFALRKVTFATGYIPNVQFTPFYLAVQKGYFEKEGIAVDFNYAMGAEPLKLIADGKFEFGTADGDALFAAVASGLPLVSVFQLYQKSPIAVFALADKKIAGLKDLTEKKIGIPGLYGSSYVSYTVAAQKPNALSRAKLQVIGYTQVQALLHGSVDAVIGYGNNEPVVLEARGHKVDVFPLSDVVWLPGNGIVVSEKLLASDEKLVRSFLRAVSRGVEDTIANPDAAFEAVAKVYLPELKSPAQIREQQAVLQKTLEYWKPTVGKIGEHDLEKLAGAQKSLLESKVLRRSIDVKKTFNSTFLR